MKLAVDFHAHVYPTFSMDRLFHTISTRVRQASADAAAIFLTERHDCNWFSQNFPASSSNAALIDVSGIPVLFVRGFQVVSREGIEVHALDCSERPPENYSLSDTIAEIRVLGGQPMLGWGAGKWFARRGQTISDFLASENGKGVYLGDSRHRPIGWPTPSQFSKGIILNGSDPLNIVGEERAILSFGNLIEVSSQALSSVSTEMLLSEPRKTQLGARLDPIRFGMLQTQLRLMQTK